MKRFVCVLNFCNAVYLMNNFTDLIQKSYDREVERYLNASDMQHENLRNLLQLAAVPLKKLNYEKPDLDISVLDIGCGAASVVGELSALDWLNPIKYLGIDISPKMIDAANSLYKGENIQFKVANANDIPVQDNFADFVISNSAIHWANQEKLGLSVSPIFDEIKRASADGGVVAVSIAAQGTGLSLLEVFRKLIDEERSEFGIDEDIYSEDPVGVMSAHHVVNELLRIELEVIDVRLQYEPILFSNASEYMNAVRAYGFEMFTASIIEQRKEIFWSRLENLFVNSVESGPYRHNQYMIYAVARNTL